MKILQLEDNIYNADYLHKIEFVSKFNRIEFCISGTWVSFTEQNRQDFLSIQKQILEFLSSPDETYLHLRQTNEGIITNSLIM